MVDLDQGYLTPLAGYGDTQKAAPYPHVCVRAHLVHVEDLASALTKGRALQVGAV